MSATRHAAPHGLSSGASLLASMRRLTAVADRASEPEQVFKALASELMVVPGAEEILIHHLGTPSQEKELVVVYVLSGDGRFSYLCPRIERPPAVGWVASSQRSFLALGEKELLAGVPRLAKGAPHARSALLMPLLTRGSVQSVVVLVGADEREFDDVSLDQASTLVDQAGTALSLVRARAEAGTDAVTACMNHRAMRRRLHEEIARAQRTGGSLSCLLMDLDDFKLVNDRYGHQTGDAVLRAAAAGLMGEFRAFDRVARYGGDEFVVILPETDLANAMKAGERAASRLAEVSEPLHARGVCASIGVAEWRPGMSVDELLAASDAALLQGKREGKSRVTAAT